MNTKIISAFVIIVFAGIAVSMFNSQDKGSEMNANEIQEQNKEQTVKEFSMDSYVNMVDGKPAPRFSLENITVKKGDKVKIKINTINGTHDFVIDEFNVRSETPTGKETVVEFTADKAGEFVYYCNMPGHRANGHWGTLTVLE